MRASRRPGVRKRRETAIAVCLLTGHSILYAWIAISHSPTVDEIVNLSAGVSHWHLARFELASVNPPLPRMISALPVVASNPATDWSGYDPSYRIYKHARDFRVAHDFLQANGKRTLRYGFLARLAGLPLSVLGGLCCYRWARRLYGRAPALLALTLWCVSPNILGYGPLVTADLATTVLGLLACYCFWRWLKTPGARSTVTSGVALGLALLAKFTSLVLVVIWPVIWITVAWSRPPSPCRRLTLKNVALFFVIPVVALYVLNLGYGFEGSFRLLGQYEFASRTLSGHDVDVRPVPSNRFAQTPLALVLVPLPREYVLGVDQQMRDFDQQMPSYLRGEWRARGWWYYYLYALAIKVPLGTWMLVFLAAAAGLLCRGYSADWRDEVVLLAPAVALLALVSSQTGLNHHMRYVLPAFPFVFIWVSKVARAVDLRHRPVAALASAALLASAASSLWAYPHGMSYFNELVGGPSRGQYHLLDSNIDWGQDLLYLEQWQRRNPHAAPLRLAVRGSYDPRIVGMDAILLSPLPGGEDADFTLPTFDLEPGWYAISVGMLHGPDPQFAPLLRFQPAAMAGYSIYVYHLTLDEANHARRELALPELPDHRDREQEGVVPP